MIKHSKLRIISLLIILLIPVTFYSSPIPRPSPEVYVSGGITPDKIKKGRRARGVVQMDIGAGLHVQSSKPLDKFLVATKLTVEVPSGMQVGPISYPRAVMRKLKFSKNVVAVYEGKSAIRFDVIVPANYSGGSGEIKGKLRFQACNDESCFPPTTQEVKMWLNVE